MGQYWKVVNIDRKEQLLNNGGLKLWEMLMNGCMKQLVELMQKPKWIPLTAGVQARLLAAKSKSAWSPLLTLPQEIIDMIIHNVSHDSPESVIYLSLTCVFFFRLLGPEFQRILARDNAPWAGDRLIVIGDYADGLDVGHICTSDELLEFEEDKEAYDDNHLYRIAGNRVMCTEDKRANERGDNIRQPGALEERVKEKLIFNGLSSLTLYHSKQYVRDDAIAESDYAYSLGEVVAVFTTWTNDGSGLVGLDGQGLWAGHRFDIATMADVSEDGWTDFSELAVENLRTATAREKKNGKRAYDATVGESVIPHSSFHDSTSDDSYNDVSFHSRRKAWID